MHRLQRSGKKVFNGDHEVENIDDEMEEIPDPTSSYDDEEVTLPTEEDEE